MLDKARNDNCEHCGDTGLVRVYGAEDYGVSFESEACDHCALGRRMACEDCDGTGWVYEPCGCYQCEYSDEHGRDIPCASCSQEELHSAR